MWYIVGLGNPGKEYAGTRHNIGWVVLDVLRATHECTAPFSSHTLGGTLSEGSIEGQEVTLFYPHSFMNNSGGVVKKFVPPSALDALIVIHDDIDIAYGEIKIVVGRGAGGNNGVASIIASLDTNAFIRVRVGIAPRSIFSGEVKRPKGGGPLERFVLKPFSGGELKKLPEITDRAAAAVAAIVKDGPTAAMNAFN